MYEAKICMLACICDCTLKLSKSYKYNIFATTVDSRYVDVFIKSNVQWSPYTLTLLLCGLNMWEGGGMDWKIMVDMDFWFD